jgi:2-C-methyl-D-erythritol 4-phosphate cytidylyltransferase
MPQYRLVVPAAGTGSRFGGTVPKQYLPLAGRTVLDWSLAPFLADARCLQIVVALDANDQYFAKSALQAEVRVRSVIGGAARSDSVWNALQVVGGDDHDWVLVHDAARPCVSHSEIDTLLAELASDPVGGLLALPMADTIKRADAKARVAATMPRETLWRALTPQMFRLGPLRAALRAAQAANRTPTDDAQAMEWCGHLPQLVRGNAQNLKITETADLSVAAAILTARQRAE